jgi:hypothetical protein
VPAVLTRLPSPWAPPLGTEPLPSRIVSPAPLAPTVPTSLPLEQYLDAIVAGTMTVHNVLLQVMALHNAFLQ